MKRITVTFTTAELALLRSMVTDQLFRREFIDPRLRGYRSNAAEIALGKQLVERLRLLTDAAMGTAPTRGNGMTRLRVRDKD